MTERQALVGQALDIAQHMATAYRQAPEHIRRMLNQVLFDKVYITPDDETGLLTAIVRYQPPFDGVLGVRDVRTAGDGLQRTGGNAAGVVEEMDDDLDATDSGTSESKTMASDTPASPRDDEVTLSQPSDIVVSGPEDVSLHDLSDDGLPALKSGKNKQKPTSWGFHDVGLSVDSMVGVTRLELATSRPPAVRATSCATPRQRLSL
jgi:recombinase